MRPRDAALLPVWPPVLAEARIAGNIYPLTSPTDQAPGFDKKVYPPSKRPTEPIVTRLAAQSMNMRLVRNVWQQSNPGEE